LHRSDLGRRGEDVAAAYLERRGLRILGRNVQVSRGEIDLVALEGGCLVFVEVKSRCCATAREMTGLETFDLRKRSALRRACGLFRKRLRPPPESYRLDVVVVDFPPGGAAPWRSAQVRGAPARSAPSVRWYPAVLDLDASWGPGAGVVEFPASASLAGRSVLRHGAATRVQRSGPNLPMGGPLLSALAR
jgi:putative endonuclease